MNGMDGLWHFTASGCALIDDGDAVISYDNLSGESADGKFYWSGSLNLNDGTVLASDLLVQSPDHKKTWCALTVTGSYGEDTAQLEGKVNGATVSISMRRRMR